MGHCMLPCTSGWSAPSSQGHNPNVPSIRRPMSNLPPPRLYSSSIQLFTGCYRYTGAPKISPNFTAIDISAISSTTYQLEVWWSLGWATSVAYWSRLGFMVEALEFASGNVAYSHSPYLLPSVRAILSPNLTHLTFTIAAPGSPLLTHYIHARITVSLAWTMGVNLRLRIRSPLNSRLVLYLVQRVWK